jgi:hypothetical protein
MSDERLEDYKRSHIAIATVGQEEKCRWDEINPVVFMRSTTDMLRPEAEVLLYGRIQTNRRRTIPARPTYSTHFRQV